MVKAYTTKRKGNDGRTYVGANINNRQFEVKVPTKNSILMSKGMGAVLNSKNGRAGTIVGGKIIKGVKKAGKFLDKHLIQPSRDHRKQLKEQDDKWREEGEDLMAGRERVSLRKKGRSTSDGYMARRKMG